VAGKLKQWLQDGLEVVATGQLTTHPGRSQYQLVIDSVEPAGIGALLKMIEERKQRLAAEGLFAPARKKALPFLPRVIGVVTSPTGGGNPRYSASTERPLPAACAAVAGGGAGGWGGWPNCRRHQRL
jgi:hypothetical protein